MKKIQLPEHIFDEESNFHQKFSEIMGFPGFYGNNWNAWIDCMSYIDEPQEQMSKVTVSKNELFEIEIDLKDGNDYYKTKTWGYFCSCVAAVNGRFASAGSSTRLIVTEKSVVA